MKSLKYFALALLAGAVLLTNCKKDEDLTAPTITVSPATTTAWQGDTVTFTVTLSGNQKFKTLTITPNQDQAGQSETVTTFSGDYAATHTYTYVVPGTVTDGMYITVTFKIVDDEDLETTATAQINIEEPAPDCDPIDTYASQTLGSYDNVAGSFFASATGTIYTVATAATNCGSVDFVYGYGVTNHATIFAPDDDVSGMADISNYGIANWTTTNATRFKEVSTSYTWANIVEDCEIVTECASGCTEKFINDLSDGAIVAFITAAGKKGFIKVNTITGSDSSGSISIDVKVQQ
ncbi:MAG: hypothetical protein KJ607_09645 [Bacteroidetes bacterium]|nr:hypothetical protein [Bacteroidota bacterium]